MSELLDEQAITRDSWTVLPNTDPAHDMRVIAVGAMARHCFPGAAARRPGPVDLF